MKCVSTQKTAINMLFQFKDKVAFLDKVIQKFEENVLAWGIIIITIVTIGNVISRYFFNYSWIGTYDLSKSIIIIITFFGIGYGVRQGRHIRMSAFYDLFMPKIRKVLIIIISFITSMVMLYLFYYSISYFLDVRAHGALMPALRIPLYWVYFFVPFGFFVAAIEYFLAIWINLKEKEVYLSTQVIDTYEVEGTLDGECHEWEV